jgi:hypothetical protein
MALDAPLAVVIAATALDGIAAGVSPEQSIAQLPPGARIGALDCSGRSRAGDPGDGMARSVSIGSGAVFAAIAAIVPALVASARGDTFARALPAYGGAALSLLHALAPSRAAPIIVSQRRQADEVALRAAVDRPERWETLRATLQPPAFGAMHRALVVGR